MAARAVAGRSCQAAGPACVMLATAVGTALSVGLAVPPLSGLVAADPLRLAAATVTRTGATHVGALVQAGAAATLLLCTAWWLVIATALAVEAVTGVSSRRLTARCPLALRRAVLLLCGAAVGSAAITVPSAAQDAIRESTGPAPAALRGLPVPDRQVARIVARRIGGPACTPGRRAAPPPPSILRVRPGDTLWSLAADLLPPGAPVLDVDVAWRLVYRVNRAAVGVDPDLIVPGMRLRVPAALPPPVARHPDGRP